MPRRLQKIPFRQDLLPLVENFECGDEPWEREVADWIRGGPNGVLDALKIGCEVWLYVTQDDGVVGFGSLATSRWRYPEPHSPRAPITLIPMLGIQSRFWGQPEGPRELRFSSQILDDLIYMATERRDRTPLLGLFVHPDNGRAITVYERAGFTRFSYEYRDQETGVSYQSMVLDL